MNNICVTQNERTQLQRLGAQRHLYSTAKLVFLVQVVLSGPVAVAFAFSALVWPEMKGFAALFGLVLTAADIFAITPWRKNLTDTAAKIQEAFDCDVLEMPWHSLKAGKRIDPEVEIEHSIQYQKVAQSFPPLSDWYSAAVAPLPISVARVVCQRTNCYWDSKQRRKYALWIVCGVLGVVVAIFVIGLLSGLTVEALILRALTPLMPAIVIAVRQFTEHRDAARRLDTLKDHANQLFEEACSNPDAPDLLAHSRALQDEIFDSRKRSPPVLDQIFRRIRTAYEVEMNLTAAKLAESAAEKIGIKRIN